VNDRSWIRQHLWRVLAGAFVVSIALGIRQTFGLFIAPYGEQRDISLASLSFAIALQNLVWGLAQPLTGAATDRFGASGVIVAGALLYSGGLALAAFVPSAGAAVVGIGVLVGLGMACMTFAVVLPAVGRAVPEHARGTAVALAAAGGSIGQALLVPVAQSLLLAMGVGAVLVIMAIVSLFALPLAPVLRSAPGSVGTADVRMRAVVKTALGNRGYMLLTIGFFTCGFQLAFITTHLPTYLRSCHVAPQYGALALSLIGLFNIVGSWGCGVLAVRFPPQLVLSVVYLVRGLAIAGFAALPPTPLSIGIFGALMGLLWLGTVPLTSATIDRLFGVRYLGTLFGICFLSHQLGSFAGAELGGLAYAATGSYTGMWWLTAALGLFAAAVNLPIKTTRVAFGAAT
jgi:MFS family permease